MPDELPELCTEADARRTLRCTSEILRRQLAPAAMLICGTKLNPIYRRIDILRLYEQRFPAGIGRESSHQLIVRTRKRHGRQAKAPPWKCRVCGSSVRIHMCRAPHRLADTAAR